MNFVGHFFPALTISLFMSAFTGISRAQMIHFESKPGNEKLGAFTGSFEYAPLTGVFTVSLRNVSPAENEGRLVAFAFNNPSGRISTASMRATGVSGWELLGSPSFNNGISAPPFGSFDIGASSSGDWLGGGSPNRGLPVGATATFVFQFGGPNLHQLTTQSFVESLNTTGDFLAVRFRGFEDGGSDKVTAFIELPPIPEPAAFPLMGVATLVGFVACKRRKLRSAAGNKVPTLQSRN